MGVLEIRYSLHISNAHSSLTPLSFIVGLEESQGYVSFDLVPFSGKQPTASKRKMEPKKEETQLSAEFRSKSHNFS